MNIKSILYRCIQYLSFVTFTLLIAIYLKMGGFPFFLVIMSWWFLTLPLLIVLIITLITSLRFKRKEHYIFSIWGFILVVLFLLPFPKNGNKTYKGNHPFIMEEQYEKYKGNMFQLVEYVQHAIDDNCGIEVEFEDGRIKMFHIMEADSNTWLFHWNDDIAVEMLMKKVGLDALELEYIHKTLNKMSCMSVEVLNRDSRNYSIIGFRRVGMGKYYYRIYEGGMSEDEMKQIYNDYTMIYYNDSVAFEYGAGAIGNLNFSGKNEYMDYRRKQGKDSIYWNVYKMGDLECDSIYLYPNQSYSLINHILDNPKLEIKGIEMLDNGVQLIKYVIHK